MRLFRLFPAAVVAFLIFTSASAFAASFISTGDGGWEWQYPLPQGHILYSTHFANASSGWAAGDAGTILKTTNGGASWVPQTSGTDVELRCVRFLDDATTGWAVGPGAILKTTNGGQVWTKMHSGMTYAAHFVDAYTGWVAGADGIILKTTDGGVNWQPRTSNTNVLLLSIDFIDPSTGWAVGENGEIISTTDGGTTWQAQTSGVTESLWSVDFLDASNGWAVGDNGTILRTINGGGLWTPLSVGESTPLTFVRFIDANTVWAGGLGSSYKITNNAGTWTPLPSAAGSQIYGMSFVGAVNGWAVGHNGAMLRTIDGGANWQSSGTLNGQDLWSIFSVGDSTAWIVGGAGTILKTFDGGATWSTQYSDPNCRLFSTFFVSANTGWAAGITLGGESRILKTVNGGTDWTPQSLPDNTRVQLMSAYFTDANTGWAAGYDGTILKTVNGSDWTLQHSDTSYWLNSIRFVNSSVGWAVGGSPASGVILKTTNGGANWGSFYTGIPGQFWAADACDANIAWAVGDNGLILKTTDGGATGNQQVSGVDGPLLSVQFMNSQVGWIAGRGILHTSNGGDTWSPQNPGWPYSLHCIRFSDVNNGWAVGSDGALGSAVLHTSTAGLPGCVWAKLQPDGQAANFGHIVVVEKHPGYIYVEHPNGLAGIRIYTTDTSLNPGDFIYVHGSVGTVDGRKVINAQSIDVQCVGWGSLAPFKDCVWAKTAHDGLPVSLGESILTAKFPGFAYIEQPDRVSGIRVNTSDSRIKVGDLVGIHGVMTTTDGERAIDAASIEVLSPEWGTPPPLGLNTKALGGGDFGVQPDGQLGVNYGSGLNNIGLLVRTFGLLDHGALTITDGGPDPVKLEFPNGDAVNPAWTFVAVTGIISRAPDGARRILVRSAEDITPF